MSSAIIGAPLATVAPSAAARHRVMRRISSLSFVRPGPDQAVTGSAVRRGSCGVLFGERLGFGRGDCTPPPPRVHRVPRVRLHLGGDRSVHVPPTGSFRE